MSDSKMLEIADENQKVMLALFQELDALVIKADVTGVHETVRKILDAKENFYEKLWKDFCSLQRGDASKLVQQAEKATKLEEEIRKNSRPWSALSLDELARIKGEVDQAYHFKVLGDPRKAVEIKVK